MSNSMSFSTVRGAAGVLPTPSSCSNTNVNFHSSANTAGCVFSPQGSDIKPFQECCDDAPVLTFSDGCGFYCEAKGQTTGELSNCLKKRSNNVSCQSNSGDGSVSESSSSSSGGSGGDSNVNNSFNGDGSSGSSSSSSSSGSGSGDDDDNNDDDSDDMSGTSSWGSDFPDGSAAYTTHFATSTATAFTRGGGSPQSDDNGGGVVASTEAVAGPGQTANAATSVGPNGASGTGTTIGGAATSDFFGTAGSSGAAAGTGAGNSSSPTTPSQPAASSFTGAAVAVPVPGAGVSKGGLFAVAVLVLGAMTGAAL